ncbi:unnamed protein product [Prorocentrum cordatum]|uniref:Apple domain-containing protein n=1 Tax=Prorocentrum cordatum TaxID=2364126 RepID=A0ABN9T7X1_9DINO|nr:unnamed protein product [Polarella glacialis]
MVAAWKAARTTFLVMVFTPSIEALLQRNDAGAAAVAQGTVDDIEVDVPHDTATLERELAKLNATVDAKTVEKKKNKLDVGTHTSSYTLLGDGDCRCSGDGPVDRYRSSAWSDLGYDVADCQDVCSSYSWCQALLFGNGIGGWSADIYAAPNTDSIRPASITNFDSGQAFRGLDCEVTEVNDIQGQCYLKVAAPPATPSPTPGPTPGPTPSPTPAPTSAPTAAQTTTPGGAAGGATAVGDPHLQNIHGQRFDLMMPGKHVLVNVPRESDAENALLRVSAVASRLGGECQDIYFTELNITGFWAYAQRAGGYRFRAQRERSGSGKWFAVGKVWLKVVNAHTDAGTRYLNLFVKHLGRTGLAVGGLLGDGDHAGVSELPASCLKRMSLQRVSSSVSSAAPIAIATFA